MPPIPSITDFVMYSERSIRVGRRARVFGGDIGVHAVAQSSFGFQLTIGSETVIEPSHPVFSPSISLGRGVRLGSMSANSIEDNGIALGSLEPFPASSMPPLPLVPIPPAGGSDIGVSESEVLALLPGNYDALVVNGIVAMNPGGYTFSSVTLGDRAKLVAIAGDVRIDIGAHLTAGRDAEIYPAFRENAGDLLILVAGNDQPGVPAVSLGERTSIRALLAAPHGSVSFADRVQAQGAFAGMDIALGEDVRIEFENGFSQNARGQQGSQQLQGYYGPHPDPAVAPLVGPVPADTIVPVNIGLPVRDPQGLQTFIEQVSDPKNPLFRKHLTQAEFYATYGAADADYASLKTWAINNGLTIDGTYPNNLLLSVSGPAAQVGQALYVNLVYRLRPDGTEFVAVDREPSVDLAVAILEITGLTDFRLPQPAQVNGTGGSSNNPLYRADDLRQAYVGPTPALLELTGSGQVIGLLELNSFSQSDIEGYDALQNPPRDPGGVTLNIVQGPPIFTSYSNDPETALDIEMVQAMAPDAQVISFLGNTGITSHGDTIFHAMATSSPPLTCASC